MDINHDNVILLKQINISNNLYMIAVTNASSIIIDERYISKQLLERKK